MAKKQKPKIKKKIPTPEQEARAETLRELHEGTIKANDFDSRLLDLTIKEFSDLLAKMRGESKDIFFRGIIVGAIFGFLGNAFVASLFKWFEIQNWVTETFVVSSGIAFIISILIVYFRWKKIIY